MIDNRRGSEHCPYCQDTGQVVVGVRRYLSAAYEDFGPCQACALGAWTEFPGPDKNGKPQVGFWGEEGFWRGRKMEAEPSTPAYLSIEENRRRWRELGLSTGLLRKAS